MTVYLVTTQQIYITRNLLLVGRYYKINKYQIVNKGVCQLMKVNDNFKERRYVICLIHQL